MGAIYKREMRAFFTSPIAYIYLAIFYVISAFYFVGNNIMGATTDMSYAFLGIFMIIMLFIPLLTMRLMSDEKKQKTDQGLLTAPVNLAEIVLGKFFSLLEHHLFPSDFSFHLSPKYRSLPQLSVSLSTSCFI